MFILSTFFPPQRKALYNSSGWNCWSQRSCLPSWKYFISWKINLEVPKGKRKKREWIWGLPKRWKDFPRMKRILRNPKPVLRTRHSVPSSDSTWARRCSGEVARPPSRRDGTWAGETAHTGEDARTPWRANPVWPNHGGPPGTHRQHPSGIQLVPKTRELCPATWLILTFPDSLFAGL